jgi:hypothetical protein
MNSKMKGWEPVVFASDLPDCDCCEDKWCPVHKQHYADCACLGPTQDGVDYKIVKGTIYGRKRGVFQV